MKDWSKVREAMRKLDNALPDYIFDDEGGEGLANIISNVWDAINEEHAKGLPELNLGQSPEKSWACGYCGFRDVCKPDVYIKEQQDKGVWY